MKLTENQPKTKIA